ncbi:MAG: hypothetical protein ACRED1_08335 [Limisphaerales bacterium]
MLTGCVACGAAPMPPMPMPQAAVLMVTNRVGRTPCPCAVKLPALPPARHLIIWWTPSATPGVVYRIVGCTNAGGTNWVYCGDTVDTNFMVTMTGRERFFRVGAMFGDGRATTGPGGVVWVRE